MEHKQEWRVQVTVAHGVVTSAPATFKRPHTGRSIINGVTVVVAVVGVTVVVAVVGVVRARCACR